MKIYPAIDIMNGKCVRLREGILDEKTSYFENPADAAKMWASQGAEMLHVIDLDGAVAGKPQNMQAIEKIIKSVNIPVQVGGGLRTFEEIKSIIDMGASKFILGTASVLDDSLLEACYKNYLDKLIVSIDAKEGYVAINGWVNMSELSAYNFAKKIVDKGIKQLVYTDISRDGTLRGPNLNGVEKMSNIEGAKIIASGGVKDISDLKALKAIGVAGVIIGKALYNGNIDLKAALGI